MQLALDPYMLGAWNFPRSLRLPRSWDIRILNSSREDFVPLFEAKCYFGNNPGREKGFARDRRQTGFDHGRILLCKLG